MCARPSEAATAFWNMPSRSCRGTSDVSCRPDKRIVGMRIGNLADTTLIP